MDCADDIEIKELYMKGSLLDEPLPNTQIIKLFNFAYNRHFDLKALNDFLEVSVPSLEFSCREFIYCLSKFSNLSCDNKISHVYPLELWFSHVFCCLSFVDRIIAQKFSFLIWRKLLNTKNSFIWFLQLSFAAHQFGYTDKFTEFIFLARCPNSLSTINSKSFMKYSDLFDAKYSESPHSNSRFNELLKFIPTYESLRPDVKFGYLQEKLLVLSTHDLPSLEFVDELNKICCVSPLIDFASFPKLYANPALVPVKHFACFLAYPELWPVLWESVSSKRINYWVQSYVSNLIQLGKKLTYQQTNTLRAIKLWLMMSKDKPNLLQSLAYLSIHGQISEDIIDLAVSYCKFSTHNWSELYNGVLKRLCNSVKSSSLILALAYSLSDMTCHFLTRLCRNSNRKCNNEDVKLILNCIKLTEMVFLSCLPCQMNSLVLRLCLEMHEKILHLCETNEVPCHRPICVPVILQIFFCNKNKYLFNRMFSYMYRYLKFCIVAPRTSPDGSPETTSLLLDLFTVLLMQPTAQNEVVFRLEYFPIMRTVLHRFTLFNHPSLKSLLSKYKMYQDTPQDKTVSEAESFMMFLSDEGYKGLEQSYRLIKIKA